MRYNHLVQHVHCNKEINFLYYKWNYTQSKTHNIGISISTHRTSIDHFLKQQYQQAEDINSKQRWMGWLGWLIELNERCVLIRRSGRLNGDVLGETRAAGEVRAAGLDGCQAPLFLTRRRPRPPHPPSTQSKPSRPRPRYHLTTLKLIDCRCLEENLRTINSEKPIEKCI